MSRVMADIREDTITAETYTQAQQGGQSNGAANGKEKEKGKGEKINGRGEGGVNLALPKSVVEEGVKVTRESLETVCEV